MKKPVLFVISFVVLGVMIEDSSAQDFSAFTKRLMGKTEALLKTSEKLSTPLGVPKRFYRQYPIRTFNGEACIDALIKVNAAVDESALLSRHISIHNRIGNIWSITIPLRSLATIDEIPGVDRVEIDTHIRKRLDLAGIDVKSLPVHQGIGLSQPYRGEDVVVGIIDGGFDFTHPAFQNGLGSPRIMTVWDQADESGSPPDGYSYGSEYSGSTAIQNKGHDMEGTEGSHGSHVAGISAGRATTTVPQYTGMAPDADLVLVSLGWGGSGIWDGVEYIFDYAESQNKPAVVNMSLGEHIGPHDGSSLTDQVFDRLAGPGKILVGAAGNEADSQLHISRDLQGDSLATSPQMLYDEYEDAEFATIEIWGSPNSAFSVAGGLFDTGTGTILSRSDFYASDGSEYEEVQFFDGVGGEAGFTLAADARNSENQCPNIQIEFMTTTGHAMVLFVTSVNSTVHLWHVDEAPFNDLGYPAFFQAGDGESTVGEIGGTGKSVISVGAYTTKNLYTDIDGNQHLISDYKALGELASFSSHGPTRDGRVKPDICAPGNVVVAPISSFDQAAVQEPELIVTDLNNRWPYAAYEGTSMSSPMITGIVALMLEANPDLTREEIMDIFKQTAREDGFTGDIPDTGSHLWGFGKIDALEAVKAAENDAEVSSYPADLPSRIALRQNYPNPFNHKTTITYHLHKAARVKLSIYTLQGRLVEILVDAQAKPGTHRVVWDAQGVSSGIYLYTLLAGEYSDVGKCLVLK